MLSAPTLAHAPHGNQLCVDEAALASNGQVCYKDYFLFDFENLHTRTSCLAGFKNNARSLTRKAKVTMMETIVEKESA